MASIVRSERLDAQVRTLLEMMDLESGPPMESMEPAQFRQSRKEARAALPAAAPEPLAHVEDFTIPGPGGELPIRMYVGDTGWLRPALVYFHGGGFLGGDLDSHDSVCRTLAKDSGAMIIAVDYRLAPEHQFPAGVDDAYAATRWVAANVERLGIDAGNISVGGDSAGGNFATVVAMRCRAAGGPAITAQVLIYPVTDLSSFETESHREFGEGYLLTRSGMQYCTRYYLADPALMRHPEVSPLLASDLTGLPPALVITAEFDPLRDEGEAYARRLKEAGVPVSLRRYDGMIHGFVSMHGMIPDGRNAIQEAARFIGSNQHQHAEA
jgi:acetyl esterase